MSSSLKGMLPDWVFKGNTIIYQEKECQIEDWEWTCPCFIGDLLHHPDEDLLILKLEGFKKKVPYNEVKLIINK